MIRAGSKIFFLPLIVLTLAFCPPVRAQEKAAAEKIRIAVATSSLAFLVPFVAKDRGLYPKHGSEVDFDRSRAHAKVVGVKSCRDQRI